MSTRNKLSMYHSPPLQSLQESATAKEQSMEQSIKRRIKEVNVWQKRSEDDKPITIKQAHNKMVSAEGYLKQAQGYVKTAEKDLEELQMLARSYPNAHNIQWRLRHAERILELAKIDLDVSEKVHNRYTKIFEKCEAQQQETVSASQKDNHTVLYKGELHKITENKQKKPQEPEPSDDNENTNRAGL